KSGHDVVRGSVEDLLRGIEAQAIEMKFVDPVASVGDEELADRGRRRPIEVDGFTPFVLIAIGKVVLGERSEIIAVRPEMIVDDVENDAETDGVGPVDEAAEIVR